MCNHSYTPWNMGRGRHGLLCSLCSLFIPRTRKPDWIHGKGIQLTKEKVQRINEKIAEEQLKWR